MASNIGKKHAEKLAVQRLASGDKPHVALSNTGGSGGLESFGHSARRYCKVAGHYSRSSQPAALTYRKQCFLDLLGSFVKSCLVSR